MRKCVVLVTMAVSLAAQCAWREIKSIPYHPRGEQAAEGGSREEKRFIDLKIPEGAKGFATYVFFHGGGLTGGARHYGYWPEGDESVALAAVGYRLLPDASPNDQLDDAARAVAWVLDNIESYGGDKTKVFVGGHSAGAYLTFMVGMDGRNLAKFGHDMRELLALVPISGQATEHFAVRRYRGDLENQYKPKINERAALYYVGGAFAPVCSICGDRRLEWPSRTEENEFLISSIRNASPRRKFDEFHECPGRNHGTVCLDAAEITRRFVNNILAQRKACEEK